jgi:ABC-type molybdate transport system substrate-binding protein
MDRRIVIVLVAVVAVAALFFVLRPEEDDEPAAATTVATTTVATTTTAPVTTTAPERPKVSEIAIRDGTVVGGRLDARVEEGDLVELRVFADVTDEVHLHGYDLTAPVTPQKFARLRFRATLTGRFEVELEDRHLHIGQLTVTP